MYHETENSQIQQRHIYVYHVQALFWALQGHREDVALVSFHKDEERETLIALVFSIRYFAGDRVFRSQQGIQPFQRLSQKGEVSDSFRLPRGQGTHV